MADAHGSGPCVRKDVGVQLPPCPPSSNGTRRRRVPLPGPGRDVGKTTAGRSVLAVAGRPPDARPVPRRLMAPQDSIWLELDRPTNLMAITSLLWTSTPIDPDRLRALIDE